MLMRLTFILLFLSLQSAWAEEDPNCTYSTDGIYKPTFKKSDIEFSKWLDKNTYYAVLSNGKYVYAQFWACNHFGFGVDYYIPSEKYKDEQLKKEILYLAKNILVEVDYKELERKLKNTKGLLNKPFTIQHDSFSQFRISIKDINFSIMISIIAYM